MVLYDVIIVGAGVEGSSTAYHVASKGVKRVLLLEQFSMLHTRGSSHGCSRITRKAYTQPYYVHMMEEAFRLWEQIEKKSGTELYTRTGILVFGPSSEGSAVHSVASSLASHGIEHEVLSGSEANRRYPDQLTLPSDHMCVFEKDGGILSASKAVGAMQQLFQECGGTLLDQHKVTEILPGPVVTVITNKATFRTKKLVVTAGAWTPALMKKLGVELPFQVIRAEVHYWKVSDSEAFSSKNFPTFICYPNVGGLFHYYGLPIHEYPNLVKICGHGGPPVDPDDRDADPVPATTATVSQNIKQYFKGVATTPSIYESCMYTNSPDEDPVLDRHPQFRNIIIGAGFSGHGFKLSPVIGKILCELALELSPSYDLTPFRVERFKDLKSAL